jgi:hypothetical protein
MKPARIAGVYATTVTITKIIANSQGLCAKEPYREGADDAVRSRGASSVGVRLVIEPNYRVSRPARQGFRCAFDVNASLRQQQELPLHNERIMHCSPLLEDLQTLKV